MKLLDSLTHSTAGRGQILVTMQQMMVVLGILIYVLTFPGVVFAQFYPQPGLYGNGFGTYGFYHNKQNGINFPVFNAHDPRSADLGSTRHAVFQYHHSPNTKRVKNRDKLEHLGETLKGQVDELRRLPDQKLELVFLVDSSTSVGHEDFQNELKFVKKLLADFTVDSSNTRVAVVTFSSQSRVIRHIDQLETDGGRTEHHKCSLLQEDMPRIGYAGGGTFTLGAIKEAKVMRL